jgi:hypothetical protein
MRSLQDDGIYTDGEDAELLHEEEPSPFDPTVALDEEEEEVEKPEIDTGEEEEDAY